MGLLDARSALCKHIFRVFDTLPTKRQPETQSAYLSSCNGFSKRFFAHMRKLIFLENVASLLGSRDEMRKLFHYLIQESVFDE